jgi:hypothetical protein
VNAQVCEGGPLLHFTGAYWNLNRQR